MIHIARIRMAGWKCFREEQDLELGPIAYAIVARYADDPDRSNWAGKTSLLQAVDWALFGRLPEDVNGKDEVITRGESKVEVTLSLSDGSRVTRTKERNRSEKLWYWPPSGGQPAMNHEAETAVHVALGLDEDDFVNTSYFRQREMARFVLQDPSERLDTVSGWLDLEPLEQAEDLARGRLASALTELAALEREIRIAQEQEDAATRALNEMLIVSAEGVTQLERRLAATREEVARAEGFAAARREREVLEKQASAYRDTVREGKELAKVEPAPGVLDHLRQVQEEAEAKLRPKVEATAVAHHEYDQRRRLVTEGFSGVCPVVGVTCPSSTWVRGQKEMAHTRAEQAKQELARCENDEHLTRSDVIKAAQAHHEAAHTRRRLEVLRETAAKLRPAYDRVKELREPEFAEDPLPELRKREALLQHQVVTAKHQLFIKDRAAKAANVMVEQIRKARGDVAVAREAMLVFGKTGAQRRVAERALDQIGAGATAMLAEAGVNLTVALRWSREGKGIASHCADCGTPFPPSAKVKECPTCGVPRGPKLIHRLEVVLSDRSGAAEDLAAFALQMSASRWLRHERGSPWSVLLLDEPTGQLDAANRRALTAHLSKLFARSAVSQAFVVAHHASVLESLPGRIEIVATPNGSVATVKS